MNTTLDAQHLGPAECVVLNGEDADEIDPGAWLEAHGLRGDLVATMQLRGLPALLGQTPSIDEVAARPAKGAGGVLLARAGNGNLRAQPMDESRVRFNGGPPTQLAHEFEDWAMVEVAGQRFRITNALRTGDSSDALRNPTASKGARILQWIGRWSAMLAAPALVLTAALSSLTFADWLTNTSEASFWQVLLEQKETMLLGLGWWAAWCAATRWLNGTFRWRAHALVLAKATLTFGCLAVASPSVLAAASQFAPSLHLLAGPATAVGWLLVASVAAIAHVEAIAVPRVVRARLRAAVWAGSLVAALVFAAGPVWDWGSSMGKGATAAPTVPVALAIDRQESLPEIRSRLSALKLAADAARAVPP